MYLINICNIRDRTSLQNVVFDPDYFPKVDAWQATSNLACLFQVSTT